MQSLTWYFNRLSRMSAAEVAYRAAQATRATASRFRNGQGSVPAPAVSAPRSFAFVCTAPGLSAARYVERAERLIEGRYTIFDLVDCKLESPPEWNRDPLTGTLAPLVHASTLDYRDEKRVGNIKYLWEPNRHLHLPALAQAYALTGDRRYAHAVQVHVESWIEQCPCGYGPNWSSSLELAIRLINWSIAWQLLGGSESALFGGEDGRRFRQRWMESVYQHARAITQRLSRFSSANNHLIGESAGVWIASVTWGCWPQMRRWGRRCKRILETEALRQNAADGGNREQAFAYQQFVLDFLLLAGLAARAAGEDFGAEYWRRIETMLEFIAAMMDAAGRVPMIGDADDGYVTSLSPEQDFDTFRSLLATGAVLFDRADLAGKAGKIDDKTRWLLGAAVDSHASAFEATGIFVARRAFTESGYCLLGDRFETAEEIRMLVDAGPLGYLSIAAHGHADALSIVLSVGGREVLIDPGTYAYHTEPEWRSYFRGTRAHNTVLVDEQDQSRQAGNFMWSRHAQAKCLEFDCGDELQRFSGEHDGYCSLEDPVLHRRTITYDPRSRCFTIDDVLSCKADHRTCRHWHFAESLQPTLVGNELHVEVGRYLVRIVPAEPPDHIELHHGGSPLEGGWISRRFGRKTPTTTAAWHTTIRGTTTLRTHIYCTRG